LHLEGQNKGVIIVNRVKKCDICSRWKHSNKICKGKLTCPRCGEHYGEADCCSQSSCINYRKEHSLDMACLVFEYFKLINVICAYVNVDFVLAKNF